LKPIIGSAMIAGLINRPLKELSTAAARIRDGERAVALAEEANRIERDNPLMGATLAAAYAEAGRFAEAINVAERALQLAIDSRNEPLADGIRTHLALYRSGQPVRDIRQ